jgi:hypothetical protein
MKDYQGAIDDYTMSIQLFPTDPETYYFRAMAKFEIADNYDGCLDLNNAQSMGLLGLEKEMKKYCN